MPGRRGLAALLLGAALACGGGLAAQPLIFLLMGTGALGGTYYPVGRAICALVDDAPGDPPIHCSSSSTSGSVYNIEGLANGELELAIVQSDVQFDAVGGHGRWGGGALAGLRAVFSLYPEPVTIIARRDAGIALLADLQGKRMNIGSPGSGTQETWDMISATLGWHRQDLAGSPS